MRLWLSGLVVMLDFDGRISWQGRVANDDYGKRRVHSTNVNTRKSYAVADHFFPVD
jgi:hypothetical protein